MFGKKKDSEYKINKQSTPTILFWLVVSPVFLVTMGVMFYLYYMNTNVTLYQTNLKYANEVYDALEEVETLREDIHKVYQVAYGESRRKNVNMQVYMVKLEEEVDNIKRLSNVKVKGSLGRSIKSFLKTDYIPYLNTVIDSIESGSITEYTNKTLKYGYNDLIVSYNKKVKGKLRHDIPADVVSDAFYNDFYDVNRYSSR